MNNFDVKVLLLEIKKDISIVEKGEISYEIMNNIKIGCI